MLDKKTLQSLASSLPATGSKYSQEERAKTLSELVSVVTDKDGTSISEERLLALQAVGVLCQNSAGRLPHSRVPEALARLAEHLSHHTSATLYPIETPAHSSYFCALLKAIASLILEVKQAHGLAVPSFVDCLRKFWTYGTGHQQHLPNVPAQNGSVASALQPRKGAYQPPHLRRKAEGPGPSLPSDGETSDSDGHIGTGSDRLKTSKARLAALSCLHALAKCDAKSLHPLWLGLFPVYTPLAARRGDTTLLDVLARDPVSKVRLSAGNVIAALLDGTAQRAYFAIAECRTADRQPIRGFTTLSASLGQMAVAMHEALFHCIRQDGQPQEVACDLRALAALLAAAPYHRLPETLLPKAIQVACQCMQRASRGSVSSRATAQAGQVAALTSLGAAFRTKEPSAAVAAMLSQPMGIRSTQQHAAAAPGGANAAQLGISEETLVVQLLDLASSGPSLTRVEALGALRAIADNYTTALRNDWLRIVALVKMHTNVQGTAGGQEELLSQLSVRLLADFLAALPLQSQASLRATSNIPPIRADAEESVHCGDSDGSEGIGKEISEVAESSQMRRVLGNCEEAAGKPAETAGGGRIEGSMSDCEKAGSNIAEAAERWQFACTEILPQVSINPSAMVRSAAAATLAGLLEPIFESLTPGTRAQIWEGTQAAILKDDVASVRAAGARALGVLVSFNMLVTQQGLERVAAVVSQALCDESLSVRIPAATALANLADLLRLKQSGISWGWNKCVVEMTSDALKAARDNEKVRVSALRALGNLLAFAELPQGTHAGCQRWLQSALDCLLGALVTGSPKAQWNACYAVSNLLRNSSVIAELVGTGQLEELLRSLCHIACSSSNLKSRMHAAAALAVLQNQCSAELCAELASSIRGALEDTYAGSFGEPADAHTMTDFRLLPALQKQLLKTAEHLAQLHTKP